MTEPAKPAEEVEVSAHLQEQGEGQLVDLLGDPIQVIVEARPYGHSKRFATFRSRKELERLGFDAMAELVDLYAEARAAGEREFAFQCLKEILPYQHAKVAQAGTLNAGVTDASGNRIAFSWSSEGEA